MVRWAGMLMACGVLCAAANAETNVAETLPAHIAGSWGTGASLYDGAGPQSEMHLLADGYGMMAGSSAAPVRADGADDGQRPPRAIIGWPVRATWRDGVLTARYHTHNPREAAKAAATAITCHPDAQGETLTCHGPVGEPLVLKRRSDTVPDELARQIDKVR